MISHGKDIKIFTGNANPALAQEICKLIGIKLGEAEVKSFADGEASVSLYESVRGSDVFLINSTCKPVNDSLRKGFRYLEFNAKRPLTPLLSERKYRKLWRQTYQGCEWSVLTDPEAPAHDRLKSLLSLFGINALQYERWRRWVKR